MVDAHSLHELILEDGDRVSCLGDIETVTGSTHTLWASCAWQPERASRYVNSDVRIEMGAGVPPPAEGSIVLVTGIWLRGAITDARWVSPGEIERPLVAASPEKLKPAEVRDLQNAFSEGIGADDADGQLIAGGGTREASWLYVRAMTRSVATRVSAFPGRVDVVVAVTPAAPSLIRASADQSSRPLGSPSAE